jgi:hypothetical protein
MERNRKTNSKKLNADRTCTLVISVYHKHVDDNDYDDNDDDNNDNNNIDLI